MTDSEPAFTPGNRVIHPNHGPAILQYVGKEYVGLIFDDGREALLRCQVDALTPWSAAAEAEWRAARQAGALVDLVSRPAAWPESTFSFESGDATHYRGAHWEAFDEQGAEAMLAELPTYLRDARLPEPLPLPAHPAHAVPDTWAEGLHLFWPDARRGLAITTRLDAEAKQMLVVSIYPHCGDATEFDLEIDEVHVWESGVEAQIDASLSEASLSFFDTHYIWTRSEYERGRTLRFSLTGLAYDAAPCTVFELPFTPNPEQVAWDAQRALARGETDYQPPNTIQLAGMAVFIPVAEWDIDDYSFRGPVKAVDAFDDFLGQAGWKVRVTIMRALDTETDDIDLDIFVTERAWQGDAPPQAGQDIEGRLWLQGKMVNTNP